MRFIEMLIDENYIQHRIDVIYEGMILHNCNKRKCLFLAFEKGRIRELRRMIREVFKQ